MTPDQKKEISKKLKDALVNEHLWNAQAARHLNLISNYICMILNPKIWEKCPKGAWERVQAWIDTGNPISEFKIPEGERIIATAKETQDKPTPNKKLHKDKGPTQSSMSPYPANETKEPTVSLAYYKEEHDKAAKKYLRLMTENSNLIKELNLQQIQANEGGGRQRVCIDIEINLIVNGQKILAR